MKSTGDEKVILEFLAFVSRCRQLGFTEDYIAYVVLAIATDVLRRKIPKSKFLEVMKERSKYE